MKITKHDKQHYFISLPSPKRPRHHHHHHHHRQRNKVDEFPLEFSFCQSFLATSEENRLPSLPATLKASSTSSSSPPRTMIRRDIHTLKQIFDSHGVRTSLVTCPTEALSVYKDSLATTMLPPPSVVSDSTLHNDMPTHVHLVAATTTSAGGCCPLRDGKTWLLTMLGLHPDQEKLERCYQTCLKDVYCLMLFCHRIREVYPKALHGDPKEKDDSNPTTTTVNDLVHLVSGCELQCRSLGRMKTMDFTYTQTLQHAQTLASSVPRLVATLIQKVVHAEPRHRVQQLEREFQRIYAWNSTLSNAMMSLFMKEHQCHVQDIVLKQSHEAKHERITIFLHDPREMGTGNTTTTATDPPHFIFMPRLATLLRGGPEAVVETMVQSFWAHMLRQGYFATQPMKDRLSMDLTAFFLSGITKGQNVPISLNAHFSPTRPLSLYLHGKAGTGKSSFVRNFQPALEATLEEAVDPQILARFVKQNLNKHFDILGLEMELRPNNNDMSLMSIIQQRRMTMTQSKPGLVVINLEEMPSNEDPASDPNQLKVAQLMSQRFAGRNGDFQQKRGVPPPRNSDKRGIANDASLITLFTSNYVLHEDSKEALTRLKMFENLDTVHMTPVVGEDRVLFAHRYLQQCIKDHFPDLDLKFAITLDIAIGHGDIRPLVRFLRMIAFYICSLVSRTIHYGSILQAKVQQKGSSCIICAVGESIELKGGTWDLLIPLKPRVRDTRVQEVLTKLADSFSSSVDELSIVLDFWLAKTLTPAVVVSTDRRKIRALMEALNCLKEISCIQDVNADTHKMMKSLYDPKNLPNLRDDILKFGRGAYIAVELVCPTKNAQLCIREIIEDSPSMTAFSTSKSALYKDGLVFAVYVNGEITPEILSRASIVLQ